ncbi:MAG: hypothetical protein ACMX3H_17005 [Sodalis sp. (in: enterobacteria)]
MEHILTGPYNKPTNNSRRPPRGAYEATIRPTVAADGMVDRMH